MATGTYTAPGKTNTYVRNHEATGGLIVWYSQDPKKFPLSRYVKYQPVKKTTGLYLRIKAEECARVVNANVSDYLWEDGNDEPNLDLVEEFRWEDYRTKRFAIPWKYGYKAVDEADFPLVNISQHTAAHKAMVARTRKVSALLQTEGNWDTGHYRAINDIDGVVDYWDVSTVAEANIERSITYGVEKIVQDTFGMVNQEDLVLVMNPTTARRVAVSPEIKDFIKQQHLAPEVIQGKANWLGEYGLPKFLFGVETLVEKTFYISARAGASTQTKTYCLDNGNAFLLARPGAVTSPISGPNFSTVTLFFLEEMTVEQRNDIDNRRYRGRVVDDYDVVMTASPTAYWFQSVYDTSSS